MGYRRIEIRQVALNCPGFFVLVVASSAISSEICRLIRYKLSFLSKNSGALLQGLLQSYEKLTGDQRPAQMVSTVAAYVLTPSRGVGITTFRQKSTEWRPKRLQLNVAHRLRACAQSTDEATNKTEIKQASTESSTRKKSKSEEIAELLGQDTNELKSKAKQQRKELEIDQRTRYALAALSLIISGSLFAAQKLNPSSSLNLMRFLTESSAPVEVVGTNGRPSMIEFSATWCENCKVMARRVFELENEYGGRVNFVVVDGDDPGKQDIVERYGVDGVPQFSMVGSDGAVKGNLIGLVPKGALISDLEALLKKDELPFPGIPLDELRN